MLKKKTKIRIMIFILIFLSIFMHCIKVNAATISQVEYTKEYKEWLELPKDEKNNTVVPKMFDIDIKQSGNNILTKLKTLMAKVVGSDFDLRDKMNLDIKNQGSTNACWTFATLSSLETNIALKNNMNKTKDYSESHMDYSTSQSFTDGKIENGFTRDVSVGGNFQLGAAYLTNGQGAIQESDMPFIDTKGKISIDSIKNKNVVTKVTDTEEFGIFLNSFDKDALIIKMKEHIKENGSISAGIHGAKLNTNCYNNATGAIYCENSSTCKMDHNVSIIGWDDDYPKGNFNNSTKIENDGAWIIRNSWGTGYGKDGFMYVSYEDANIYNQLFGIENATENVDYDYIYQYNELGFNNALVLDTNKVYISNVFGRDITKAEELTEVALNVMQEVKCKVYVNPNSDSKSLSDLQEVELKDGKSETFDSGYHTLEFKEPIKLTGKNFVVIIEVEATKDSSIYSTIISKTNNNFWDNVQVKENVSYITFGEFFEKNEWIDTVVNAITMGTEPGNLTIKAFTRKVEVIATPTPTVRPTVTPTPSTTIKPTSTITPTPTVRPTVTLTPSTTIKPTSTITPTPTVKPTPTIKPTSTVTTTLTPKPTKNPTTAKPTSTATVRPTSVVVTMTPKPTSTSNTQILGSINTNSTSPGGSTTINQSTLPHAGKTEIIIGLIIILTINMVVVYRKYKKIY